jgi:hypothetical protein
MPRLIRSPLLVKSSNIYIYIYIQTSASTLTCLLETFPLNHELWLSNSIEWRVQIMKLIIVQLSSPLKILVLISHISSVLFSQALPICAHPSQPVGPTVPYLYDTWMTGLQALMRRNQREKRKVITRDQDNIADEPFLSMLHAHIGPHTEPSLLQRHCTPS